MNECKTQSSKARKQASKQTNMQTIAIQRIKWNAFYGQLIRQIIELVRRNWSTMYAYWMVKLHTVIDTECREHRTAISTTRSNAKIGSNLLNDKYHG